MLNQKLFELLQLMKNTSRIIAMLMSLAVISWTIFVLMSIIQAAVCCMQRISIRGWLIKKFDNCLLNFWNLKNIILEYFSAKKNASPRNDTFVKDCLTRKHQVWKMPSAWFIQRMWYLWGQELLSILTIPTIWRECSVWIVCIFHNFNFPFLKKVLFYFSNC